ncbi:hypothetical protein Tco_1525634 [Tanacetum coccineum]
MNGSIEESCGQALRWHRRDLWADDEARMIGGVGGKKLQKNGGALMRLKFFKKIEIEIFTVRGDGVRIIPDGITSPDRNAHLLEDKQVPSVGVFDEVEDPFDVASCDGYAR